MNRTTVSLDFDVYRAIKRCQEPNESISATLRRILEEEKDPADHLEDLFRDFGGKGVLTDEGRARIRSRQNTPSKCRPSARRRSLAF